MNEHVCDIQHPTSDVFVEGRGSVSIGPVGDAPNFQEGKAAKGRGPRSPTPFPGSTNRSGDGLKLLSALGVNDVFVAAGHGRKVEVKAKRMRLTHLSKLP